MKKQRLRFMFWCILAFFLISDLASQTIITLQPGPAEGKDAEVWSLDPNGNYGDHIYGRANAWTWNSVFGIQRNYLEFDLSDIPDNAQILEAELTMYYHFISSGLEQTHYGNNQSVLKRVIAPWDEYTLTWNNQPATTALNQVIVPPSSGPQQDYENIDVTQLVIDMLNDPAGSHGFFFRLSTEQTYRRIGLASSDHPDPAKWPKLTIVIDCEMPVAGFEYFETGPAYHFTDTSTYANSWFWDFGDGYSSSLQNPVHSFLSSGVYQVCLTVENDCGSDTFCDTVRPVITNIAGQVIQPSFILFPNPADDHVEIVVSGAVDRMVEYSISDALGNEALAGFFNVSTPKKSIQIDVSAIATGVYFITFKVLNERSTHRLVVK